MSDTSDRRLYRVIYVDGSIAECTAIDDDDAYAQLGRDDLEMEDRPARVRATSEDA